MKQFDICLAEGMGSKRSQRHVVLLQHHDLDAIDTVIVAPLFLVSELPPVAKVRPTLVFKDREYVVAVDRLAALPSKHLRAADGSAEAQGYELAKALDLIFSGF